MYQYQLNTFKWALVTGASSGIGREFAIQLAQKGLNLILVGRSNQALSDVASEIHNKSKVSTVILQSDLTKDEDVNRLIENLSRFNIDILVNNAGVGLYGNFLDYQLEDYENMIRLNILALTRLSYHYGKIFTERKNGGIINVASVAGFIPIPHFSVYAATKAYVYSFSMSLWAELKDKNVQVLCVAPGTTKTKFFERANMKPAKKMMKTEEVVKGALDAFEKGKPLYIPGLSNKISYHLVRRLFSDKFVANLLTKYF
ncbi:MAG: SDR family NAD(P)-dependent oxidoreductase [Fervidobacterium sp.]